MTGKTPKTGTSAFSAQDREDLTCSEGQVEDLLSEGESTEVEGAPKRRVEYQKSKVVKKAHHKSESQP